MSTSPSGKGGAAATANRDAARRRAQTVLGMRPGNNGSFANGPGVNGVTGGAGSAANATSAVTAESVHAAAATKKKHRHDETIEQLRERYAQLMLDRNQGNDQDDTKKNNSAAAVIAGRMIDDDTLLTLNSESDLEPDEEELAAHGGDFKSGGSAMGLGFPTHGTDASNHQYIVVEGGVNENDIFAQHYVAGRRLSMAEKDERRKKRIERKRNKIISTAVNEDEAARDGIFDQVPTVWFNHPKHLENDEHDSSEEELDNSTRPEQQQSGAHEALVALLRTLPVSYDDEDDDTEVECIKTLQTAIGEQKQLKAKVDRAFRVELQRYQKKVMPSAPVMLDLCDALDDSRGECHTTAAALRRSKENIEGSLRLVATHRRRKNLKLTQEVVHEVECWMAKEQAVVKHLRKREYVPPVVMLSAKLFSEAGSPIALTGGDPTFGGGNALDAANNDNTGLENSSTVPQASAVFSNQQSMNGSPERPSSPTQEVAAGENGEEQDHLAENDSPAQDEVLSSPTKRVLMSMDHDEFVASFGDTIGTTVVGRCAVARWLELKNRGAELIVTCLRDDLEALLSGVPLKDSPIPKEFETMFFSTSNDANKENASDDFATPLKDGGNELENMLLGETEEMKRELHRSMRSSMKKKQRVRKIKTRRVTKLVAKAENEKNMLDDDDIDLDAELGWDDDGDDSGDSAPQQYVEVSDVEEYSVYETESDTEADDDLDADDEHYLEDTDFDKTATELLADTSIAATNNAADQTTTLPEEPVFNRDAFKAVLDGLYALKVRGDSLPRFVLDSVESLIDKVVREALVEVIGDAGKSWEEIVDTLVPSEFHPCTTAVLAALTKMMRSILSLKAFCQEHVEEVDARFFNDETKKETDETDAEKKEEVDDGEESPTCFEDLPESEKQFYNSCKALLAIGDRAAQKCLAAVVAYSLRARLTRAPIADVLHIYRLMFLFVDVCSGASEDGAVISTKSALLFQCSRMLHDQFEIKAVEDIMKVVLSDTFMPFPASADDFPELKMYVMREEEAEITEAIKRFLADAHTKKKEKKDTNDAENTGETAPAEDDDDLTITVNPFKSAVVDPSYMPALPEGHSLQLFDGFPIFTFSSFMTCKWMFEFCTTAQGLPQLACEIMEVVNYMASVYVLFIATHFVASSEMSPLDEDASLPAAVRSHAKAVRNVTLKTLPVPGYPQCVSANCHMWKAKSTSPAAQYAVQERATAICSLETIVVAHRLCLQAVSPLLPGDTMSQYASFTEALSVVVKHCVSTGIRRLSQNLLGPEVLAVPMEKQTWTAAVSSGAFPNSIEPGAPSVGMRTVFEQLRTLHSGLKDMHRDLPTIGMSKTIMHVIFNIVLGFVEGCSRVKKFNEHGCQQLLADMKFLSKRLKEEHPNTPQRLLDYADRYVEAFTKGGNEVTTPFIQQNHAQYTHKQLIALVDRDGFMRRREVDSMLKTLGHEDRVPVGMLDGVV